MEKQRDFKIFNGFILKVMAIIFMTIDHIGYFLMNYENLQEISYIFRIIGRLAFPLFIFLIVEGVIHSKHIGKYFIRLGLLALAFLIGSLFLYFSLDKTTTDIYSPAVDLIVTATLVYLLNRKDKFSFLAILVLGFAITSLIVRNQEIIHNHEIYYSWFPFFLRLDYGVFGPLLGIAFFYAHDLAKLFLNSNKNTKNFVGTTYEQTVYNIFCCFFLAGIAILISYIDQNGMTPIIYSLRWQVYAAFAFVPILFYSGKRGYNAKWFQYGCYFYFPMHLIIIYAIFELLL